MTYVNSRPRARKKKEQRQASSDDEDEDFVQFLPALISGGAALYNAFNKSKPDNFDVSNVQGMGAYGDSINQYEGKLGDYRDMAQDYMDPQGTMATQMSKQIKGDASEQIALQNQLQGRNPFTSSGILQSQQNANTLTGMTGANKNIAQMLMGLQQQGSGMMGKAMDMQGNLSNMRGKYADIFAQQGIANTEMNNQWNAQQGGLLGQFGMGALSSGIEGVMGLFS